MKVQTWEYFLLTMPGTRLAEHESRLNALGSQGWELMSVTPTQLDFTFCLKRPKFTIEL
jgi:hypothetical protein